MNQCYIWQQEHNGLSNDNNRIIAYVVHAWTKTYSGNNTYTIMLMIINKDNVSLLWKRWQWHRINTTDTFPYTYNDILDIFFCSLLFCTRHTIDIKPSLCATPQYDYIVRIRCAQSYAYFAHFIENLCENILTRYCAE